MHSCISTQYFLDFAEFVDDIDSDYIADNRFL
jgi:hypothetical protein